MKSTIILALLTLLNCGLHAQKSKNDLITPFEKDKNYSASYEETIDWYQKLDEATDMVQMRPTGMTDAGIPLHEIIIASNRDFTPESAVKSDKLVLLINNGIHPGEPCGIDASMIFARDIINEPAILKNVIIVIIPFYNIGGGMKRGSFSRANQNGPQLYGFRGNSRNLDLNRDFIKCDAEDSKTFTRLFNKWNPDILVDTHTSNGADYSYTMTLIATHRDKLGAAMRNYLTKRLLPDVYTKMQSSGWDMIPYVHSYGVPDKGIYGFLDLPRYSSGYASLHHTFSFMPETHMLKPYKDRVFSTLALIHNMAKHAAENKKAIKQARSEDIAAQLNADSVTLMYAVDESKFDSLLFRGYESGYKPSMIHGQDRLFYDQAKPFEKKIPYFNYLKDILRVKSPDFYFIPQGYKEIIDRLKWNGVLVSKVEKDTILKLEMYKILKYKTSERPYEGHYLHSQVDVEKVNRDVAVRKGDFIIPAAQFKKKFIVNTLEPQAPDSYFAWNFFDGVLMEKEHYSAYVFEDLAWEILESNPQFKEKFLQKKNEEPEFAANATAQLDYIYKNSRYYEDSAFIYPVGRGFYAGRN